MAGESIKNVSLIMVPLLYVDGFYILLHRRRIRDIIQSALCVTAYCRGLKQTDDENSQIGFSNYFRSHNDETDRFLKNPIRGDRNVLGVFFIVAKCVCKIKKMFKFSP